MTGRTFVLLACASVLMGQAAVAAPAPAPNFAPKPAAKKLAVRPAGASTSEVVEPTRLVVLRFSGPVAWDIDADELWKLKNHTGQPTEGDLAMVPEDLKKSLAQALANRMGATVVPNQELEEFQAQTAPSVNQSEQMSALARKLGARYALSGTIDRLEFDGNTVTPDDYVLIVSPRLIDTTNGQVVWQRDLRKFKMDTYTKSSGLKVESVFSERLIPDMAQALASDIAGALGR